MMKEKWLAKASADIVLFNINCFSRLADCTVSPFAPVKRGAGQEEGSDAFPKKNIRHANMAKV